MRKGLLGSLAGILLASGHALAQTPVIMPTAGPAADPVLPGPAPAITESYRPLVDWYAGTDQGNNSRVWVSGEYLRWWLRDAPLSAPIVTTVPPGTVVAPTQVLGALGSPGTQVVSPNSFSYGSTSGVRVSAGMWLDCERTIGVEASGFLLGQQSAHFTATSPVGGPALFVPFVAVGLAPPFESAIPFGNFGATNGTIAIADTTQLWGSEINGVFALANNERFCLTLLGGFRYLDLTESLGIDVLGAGPGPVGTLQTIDQIGTRNQFFGGQLGGRGEMHFGNFFASATAKVALGTMQERVTANGGFVFNSPAGTAVGPGGFFVLPSNIGQQNQNVFAVVPQVGLQLGYEVTQSIRVFAGYEFLYLSDVVRSGDQIDRRVNFSQQALPVGGGGLVGAPLPQLPSNHTDFWAHGLSLGLQLRF